MSASLKLSACSKPISTRKWLKKQLARQLSNRSLHLKWTTNYDYLLPLNYNHNFRPISASSVIFDSIPQELCSRAWREITCYILLI